jgi:hypothetical protein
VGGGGRSRDANIGAAKKSDTRRGAAHPALLAIGVAAVVALAAWIFSSSSSSSPSSSLESDAISGSGAGQRDDQSLSSQQLRPGYEVLVPSTTTLSRQVEWVVACPPAAELPRTVRGCTPPASGDSCKRIVVDGLLSDDDVQTLARFAKVSGV